jgi:hypothetical protein
MILAFELDYRSDSGVYERIFLRTLEEHNLRGEILKEGFRMQWYVLADTADTLGEFASALTEALPHSIILYDTQAQIVDTMPDVDTPYILPPKLPQPFCPRCKQRVTEDDNPDYYNVFAHCDVCGYGTEGEARDYEPDIVRAADAIIAGEAVEVTTHYGTYRIGLPNDAWAEYTPDLLVYDLATVQKYAQAQEYELTALAAFEKPMIRFKTTPQCQEDYPVLGSDPIRFRLPDDMVLHLLMEALHRRLVDLVAITTEPIDTKMSLDLVQPLAEYTPIEVVASPTHIAILSGDRGLPEPLPRQSEVLEDLSPFYSIIREHGLTETNIIGLNLRRDGHNAILVHGEKFGTIEYLSVMFRFETVAGIFREIIESGETGKKLIANYRKTFPELYDRVKLIRFDDPQINLFRLWGIVSMIFGLSDTTDPLEAARVLEANATAFGGTKGPRIDYIPIRENAKVSLDPLKTIRSAISFKLADVDPQGLSYGVIESFLEFVGNELNEIQQSMNTTAIAVYGSLLENKDLFAKIVSEASTSHAVYFNNQLPVEGRNALYGGASL